MGAISDERMAYIRRATGDGAVSVDIQMALLAEVDRLQHDLSKAKRGGHTLGQIFETQAKAALDATGLHHLIASDGDGDWGAVWENLAELGDRARAAEAALARVTDDSMVGAIRDEIAGAVIGSGCHETSVGTDEAEEMASWVHAAICATVRDKQSTS